MLHIFARYFFPDMVRGDYEIPECHLELIEALASTRSAGIVFPRGFAKTTWEKVDTLHDMAYGLEPLTVFFGATSKDVGLHVGAIKRQLETNLALRECYGALNPRVGAPGTIWNSEHMRLTNGVNFLAGVAGKGRGMNVDDARPTKVVIDDGETDEMVRSEHRRAMYWDWIAQTIDPSLDKARGRMIVIGTAIHVSCAVLRFHRERGGIFRAAVEDGESIWPQYWSLADLYAKRDGCIIDGKQVLGIGSVAFAKEYLNNPLDPEALSLRPEWIDAAMKVAPVDGRWDVAIHLDPKAGEKRTSDSWALTAVGRPGGDTHRYVLEQVEGAQPSPIAQAKALISMYRRWKRNGVTVRSLTVEVVLNQTAVWQTLQDWKSWRLNFSTAAEPFEESDRNVPISQWSPEGTDKLARRQEFDPEFERGEIHLRPEMTKCRDQLCALGMEVLDHDDLADSLVAALQCLGRSPVREEKPQAAPENETVAGDMMGKVY